MRLQEGPRDFAQLSDEIADEGDSPAETFDLAGADPDIKTVLAARAAGIRWKDIPKEVGWGSDRRRVQAALGRLRRLDPPRVTSVGSGKPYKERLASGRWCWSFQPQSDIRLLEEVMFVERENLFPLSRQKSTPSCLIASREELLSVKHPTREQMEEELRTERDTLTRLEEKLKSQRGIAENCDLALREAQNQLKGEHILAPLENRSPQTSEIEKEIQVLEAAVNSKKAELSGVQDAIALQHSRVQNIADNISCYERNRKLKIIEPLIKRYVDLRKETVILAEDIRQEAREVNLFWNDFFTADEHDCTKIARFHDLFVSQGAFLSALCMYDPKLRGELYRRYPKTTPETWAADA